jgi:hypothetical protein
MKVCPVFLTGEIRFPGLEVTQTEKVTNTFPEYGYPNESLIE